MQRLFIIYIRIQISTFFMQEVLNLEEFRPLIAMIIYNTDWIQSNRVILQVLSQLHEIIFAPVSKDIQSTHRT